MLTGFRDYLLEGKAADLAIAVILAVAFGDVIKSLVGNIVAPIFGLFGSPDGLSGLQVGLGGAIIPYGTFLTDLIGFIMISAVVYLGVVRPLQSVRERALGPVADTTTCHACLSTIPARASRCAFCTSMQTPDDAGGSPDMTATSASAGPPQG